MAPGRAFSPGGKGQRAFEGECVGANLRQAASSGRVPPPAGKGEVLPPREAGAAILIISLTLQSGCRHSSPRHVHSSRNEGGGHRS